MHLKGRSILLTGLLNSLPVTRIEQNNCPIAREKKLCCGTVKAGMAGIPCIAPTHSSRLCSPAVSPLLASLLPCLKVTGQTCSICLGCLEPLSL